jgi:hypothetical protein
MDTLAWNVESIQSQGGNFITPMKDSRRQKPESEYPTLRTPRMCGKEWAGG